MSQAPSVSPNGGAGSNSVPAWISSGILGLVVGAGATLLALQGLRPNGTVVSTNSNASATASPAPAGMPGTGSGGASPTGMGGGGGRGGSGGKRALTALVGKLELLSRPELKLRVDLDDGQAKAIAAKLAEFEKGESMSADEAQQNVDAIEAILSGEQKEALSTIGLPGGGGRGGRGGGGGGMGMGMGGGGNPTENPFTQEANQKRLRDLLIRLAPAKAEADQESP